MAAEWGRHGAAGFMAYCMRLMDFFKYLMNDLTPTELQKVAQVISSSEMFETTVRVFRESCGLSKGAAAAKDKPCADWFKRILLDYSDDVGRRFMDVVAALDQPTRNLVSNSEEAARGLAMLLQGKYPGAAQYHRIVDALTNPSNFGTNTLYKQDAFLADCRRLLSQPGTRVEGIGTVVGNLADNGSPEDLGKVFELFAAARLAEDGGTVTMVGIEAFDEIGVDAIIDGAAYQMKKSRNALLEHAGGTPYRALENKLKSQRGAIKRKLGDQAQWKLAMPASAIDDVQQDAALVALLTRVGLWPPAVTNLPDLP